MSRLLVALFLCGIGLLSEPISAQEMTPLQNYVGQNDLSKNPGAMGHVLLRCASLMTIMANYAEKQEGMQKAAKIYRTAGERFLDASLKTPGMNQSLAVDQSARMEEAYIERALRAKALTGNVFDDPVLRSDAQFCSSLSK